MKTASTASGRQFRYELWSRHVRDAGPDFVTACWYHRGIVRLFDCRDEDGAVLAEMLRALDWKQLARRVWVCADCAQDPMLKTYHFDQRTGQLRQRDPRC